MNPFFGKNISVKQYVALEQFIKVHEISDGLYIFLDKLDGIPSF